jgi:hypothetical protein
MKLNMIGMLSKGAFVLSELPNVRKQALKLGGGNSIPIGFHYLAREL